MAYKTLTLTSDHRPLPSTLSSPAAPFTKGRSLAPPRFPLGALSASSLPFPPGSSSGLNLSLPTLLSHYPVHFLCSHHHLKLISLLFVFPHPQEVGRDPVCFPAPSLMPWTCLLNGLVERTATTWSWYYPQVTGYWNSGLLPLSPLFFLSIS